MKLLVDTHGKILERFGMTIKSCNIISSKLSILKILREHWNTLYNNRQSEKGISKKDVFTFFIIPFIIALILIILNKNLEKDPNIALLTSLSIVTPLMLSLLILIYEMGQKIVDKKYDYKKNKSTDPEVIGENQNKIQNLNNDLKHIHEVRANISFTILISMLTIFLLIINTLFIDIKWLIFLSVYNFSINIDCYLLLYLLSFLIFYFLGILALTILMVLKRINFLFETRLR